MIVMKFGGTSVADATRIGAVADIVLSRRDRSPLVVVSALAGVTDLLEAIVDTARDGDREALEPLLADLERRHRWAMAGVIEHAEARHRLGLSVDATFEDLRQLLRSIRVLGELTPRARDALLGFGESLSSTIVAAALQERGLPAVRVEAREIIVTDARHGAARPDLEAVRERARERLSPRIEAGEVPVLGGFVGATRGGVPTTLGRGGSDTSAALLGAALEAAEIQIWTDVDGLMTADPRLVPSARTLPRVRFAEAAELTFHGARVLHPSAVAPAVERRIPVRVLNSMNPDGAGTAIVDGSGGDTPALAGVASRGGVRVLRAVSPRLEIDPGLLTRVLAGIARCGVGVDLIVGSEISVTLVLRSPIDERLWASVADVDVEDTQLIPGAIVCLVGAGLRSDAALRRRAVDAVASLGSPVMAVGGSANTVVAVVEESGLAESVNRIHQRFFGAEA